MIFKRYRWVCVLCLLLFAWIVALVPEAFAKGYWLPDYQYLNPKGHIVVGHSISTAQKTCESYGYFSEVPHGAKCSKYFPGDNLTCYKDCICSPEFQYETRDNSLQCSDSCTGSDGITRYKCVKCCNDGFKPTDERPSLSLCSGYASYELVVEDVLTSGCATRCYQCMSKTAACAYRNGTWCDEVTGCVDKNNGGCCVENDCLADTDSCVNGTCMNTCAEFEADETYMEVTGIASDDYSEYAALCQTDKGGVLAVNASVILCGKNNSREFIQCEICRPNKKICGNSCIPLSECCGDGHNGQICYNGEWVDCMEYMSDDALWIQSSYSASDILSNKDGAQTKAYNEGRYLCEPKNALLDTGYLDTPVSCAGMTFLGCWACPNNEYASAEADMCGECWDDSHCANRTDGRVICDTSGSVNYCKRGEQLRFMVEAVANGVLSFSLSGSNYLVDWGDGTIDSTKTHTYANAGTYDVSVMGGVTSFSFNSVSSGAEVYVTQLLETSLSSLTSAKYSSNCSKLTGTIPEFPPNLQNGNYMFSSCSNLTGTIPELPDSLTIADSMFRYCSKLEKITNIPPNLQNGNNMFQYCSNLTGSAPAKPASLTSFTDMFAGTQVTKTDGWDDTAW